MDEQAAVLEEESLESFGRGQCGLAVGNQGGPFDDAQGGLGECVSGAENDALIENVFLCGLEPAEPLTRREEEILEMIVAGKTNKQIARQLCRSERTVEYHRNRLMRKIGAHNSAELVKKAISMSLV